MLVCRRICTLATMMQTVRCQMALVSSSPHHPQHLVGVDQLDALALQHDPAPRHVLAPHWDVGRLGHLEPQLVPHALPCALAQRVLLMRAPAL